MSITSQDLFAAEHCFEVRRLKTTVLFTGLATSFSKGDFAYLISTVHRKERGGFYQTSIVKYHGAEQYMVYRIDHVPASICARAR
jgi:hypothetical protein